MLKFLKKYFLTGLFVLLPVIISVELLRWAFVKVDAILGDFINVYLAEWFSHHGIQMKFSIPGVGIIGLVILILLTGLFARNYLGRKMLKFGESLVQRVPLLNTVYNLIKQLLDSFAKFQGEQAMFSEVVYVEFPRKGVYSVAFLMGEDSLEIPIPNDQKMVRVYMPTSPNPANGFLMWVAETEIIRTSIPVEEALKTVVSMGIVSLDETEKGNSEWEENDEIPSSEKKQKTDKIFLHK